MPLTVQQKNLVRYTFASAFLGLLALLSILATDSYGQGSSFSAQAQYFFINGDPISSIVCGGSFVFNVPGSGLNQIWLTVYKNGAKTFDGLFAIPHSYATNCANDVGYYQMTASDPSSGAVLGQATMLIVPAGSILVGP